MSTRHLTEEEMQQYALDSTGCEAEVVAHVHLCENCKAGIISYQLLVSSIQQQPEPAFDFDLSASVLARLPQSAGQKVLPEHFFAYLLVFAGICLAGILLFPFRNMLLGLFAGLIPVLIFLIVPTVSIMVILLLIDMRRSYQKRLRLLDYY